MEADFSQMDNNRQTTKCNKRKKSQLVSAQVAHVTSIWPFLFLSQLIRIN